MADTTVTGRIGDQEVALINAASEATLIKLLEAMNKMAGIPNGSRPTGNAPGTATQSNQAEASTLMSKAGEAAGKLASALAEATSTVLGWAGTLAGSVLNLVQNLGKELLMGGNRVSDFTKHLEGLPWLLGTLGKGINLLAGFVDKNIDTYRSMSQVGASFGGSLTEMRMAAAQSGMSMERFSALVQSNAQTMALFGGSVSQGAQRFGLLSKQLREGETGQQLMAMGFTMDELNETLVTYSNINSRMGRDRAQSDRELIERAGNFGLELDKAAAATGLSRSQVAKTVDAMSKELNIAAMIAKLPKDQQDKVRSGLAMVTSAFDIGADALLEGARGFQHSKDAIALASISPEFAKKMKGLAEGTMDPLEAYNGMVREAKAQQEKLLQMSSAEIDAREMAIPGFKRAYAAVMQMASQTEKSAAEIEAARKKAELNKGVTAFFTKFENTIEAFRMKLQEIFLNSPVFKRISDMMDNFAKDNGGYLGKFMDSISSGFNVFLTEFDQFIADVQDESKGWKVAIKNAFNKILTALFLDDADKQRIIDDNISAMDIVGEKIRGVLVEGVKSAIGVMGDAITQSIKEMFSSPTFYGVVAAGLAGLFAVNKIKGLLGGGATATAGAGAGAGAEFSAMKALGSSFAEAAGWLMKGAAIGASMVAIGYGLGKMAEGMEPFNKVDWESMAKAGTTLGVLTGAMMLLGQVLEGPQIAAFAIGTAAIAALGLALRAFPADVLHELAVIMSTAFEGVGKTIERVFNGIGNIITKITEMRTAVIDATTNQIKELAGIPADNMFAAAKGIQAIKDALDGFSPGLFSGISQGIGNLFAPNKVGPLDKMAELGPRLAIAAEGFTAFKSAMAGFSLASLDVSDSQVSNFVTMANKFPDFNNGIAGLGAQANNLNAAADALAAFTLASKDFDMTKFTFTRDQLSTLADGTIKLRALGEQLRAAKDGFQKLDTQGLKNIRDGIAALSTEMKALTLFLQGDFAKALEAIRSKDQLGALTDLGSKLDTLNSNVSSLVAIEDASKKSLDTIAGKKPGAVYSDIRLKTKIQYL